MGHKCKKVECPGGEKWAIPFADFLSLLLALFIALFAIASQNKEKTKALKEEFVKVFDFSPVPKELVPIIKMDPQPSESEATTENQSKDGSAQKELQSAIKELKNTIQGGVTLDQKEESVLLKLPAYLNYDSGDSRVSQENAKLFIKRYSDIIKQLPTTVTVSIRGYSDNMETPQGISAYDRLDLSVDRANNVARELIRNGITPDRISTAGYGENNPLMSNGNEEGRARNRRVEFYISVPLDQAKEFKQEYSSVLDNTESEPASEPKEAAPLPPAPATHAEPTKTPSHGTTTHH